MSNAVHHLSPVTHELKQLGIALRRARLARNESQAVLAKRLGLAERTVRAVEAGDPGVAAGTLVGLLWAVGIEALSKTAEHQAAQLAAASGRARASPETFDGDF
ncbi:MAG: helix-turn-helix domain-containing protein [Pseudomonadota bacterium]|nr:helix-turn-helix domain-containing protein [Pseudomonadota bacterium]